MNDMPIMNQEQTAPVAEVNKPSSNKVAVIILIISVAIIIAVTVVLVCIFAGAKDDVTKKSKSDEDISVIEDEKDKDGDNINYKKRVNTIIGGNYDNGGIGDHVRGNKDSKVVVVEYADFQCPGCASVMPYMSQIYKEYKKDVAFVYRNFPLSYHVNAKAASMAAESAGLQGYFWDMAEELFAQRYSWMDISSKSKLNKKFAEIFEEIAPDGDVDKFKDNLDNSKLSKKIEFDTMLGRNYQKIAGTPSIYVNGEEISFDSFNGLLTALRDAIDEQLDK